jgi:hypothetical protein
MKCLCGIENKLLNNLKWFYDYFDCSCGIHYHDGDGVNFHYSKSIGKFKIMYFPTTQKISIDSYVKISINSIEANMPVYGDADLDGSHIWLLIDDTLTESKIERFIKTHAILQ